jgi:hypothetical protein
MYCWNNCSASPYFRCAYAVCAEASVTTVGSVRAESISPGDPDGVTTAGAVDDTLVSTFFFSPRETHALTIATIVRATLVTMAGVRVGRLIRVKRSARYMEILL